MEKRGGHARWVSESLGMHLGSLNRKMNLGWSNGKRRIGLRMNGGWGGNEMVFLCVLWWVGRWQVIGRTVSDCMVAGRCWVHDGPTLLLCHTCSPLFDLITLHPSPPIFTTDPITLLYTHLPFIPGSLPAPQGSQPLHPMVYASTWLARPFCLNLYI